MNYLENLKVLRTAVADEPTNLFDLSFFELELDCGTLHCTAGLATTIPFFRELGLRSECGAPVLSGLSGAGTDTGDDIDRALNYLFMPFPGATGASVAYEHLFEARGEGVWDEELDPELTNDITDKELALARLDKAISLWENA